MDNVFSIADLLKNYQAVINISGALADKGGVDTSDYTFAPNVEDIRIPGKKTENILADFRLVKRNFVGRTFLEDYNFNITLKADGELKLYEKIHDFCEKYTQNAANDKGLSTSELTSNLVVNFLGMNNQVVASLALTNFLCLGVSDMTFDVTASAKIQTFTMYGTIDWFDFNN